MGDEEDLREPRFLCAQRREQVVSPLLVLAPEDLVEDEERALVDIVGVGEVPGEGDPERDRDVVLLAAEKRSMA